MSFPFMNFYNKMESQKLKIIYSNDNFVDKEI